MIMQHAITKGVLGAVAVAALLVGLVSVLPAPASATGNGAPSGAHYNLNIIGVENPKSANMTASGHVIFVALSGKTKINLTPGEFDVIDKNGTDGTAAFQLPVADTNVDSCVTNNDGTVTCGSGVTTYSVFVRALGGKGGSATMTLCGDDPDDTTTEPICSNSSLELSSDNPRKFTNATADLLYLYNVDLDTDGDGLTDTHYNRIPLFSSVLEGYFWDYDNNGLRLAQLRFYNCSSTVGETSATIVSSSCELTGNGN